jgi:hypothetical protein
MTDLKIPRFKTEAEEARWWFENSDLVSAEFVKAAKEGRLKRGGVMRLLSERGIPFQHPQPLPNTLPDPEDIAKARIQTDEARRKDKNNQQSSSR